MRSPALLLVSSLMAFAGLGCFEGGIRVPDAGGTGGARMDGGPDGATSGTGGASGTGGTSSGTGGATSGSGGALGTPPGTGGATSGTGGASGTGGTPPGTGGGLGTGGRGTGGAGGTGGALPGTGGTITGTGGALPGTGGAVGTGGGPAGTGGALPGTGGASTTLRLTYTALHPASQPALLGMLVDVDATDTAVVIGPSATNTAMDPGPTITWLPRTGPARTATFTGAVTPSVMAIDPSNALWLAGQLFRPVTFGGPTLQPIEDGYYLVKLGANGTQMVAKAVTHPTSVYVSGAASDAQGNVYVVGAVRSADFQMESVFVTKLSPTGDPIYDRRFPGTDSTAVANDVALAPNGDVVIAGSFNGSVQIGTTLLTSASAMSGGYNGFAAILDPATGEPRHAFRFGGTVFDLANTVDVTAAGNLRIAGQLSGSSTVGGMSVAALAGGSPFIAEVTPAGGAQWLRIVSGRGIVFGASTNAAGRTFAAGRVDGTPDESYLAAVGPDPVLALPLRALTGSGANGAVAAAADRHGGVWVAGEFKGTTTFGTSPLTAPGGAEGLGNFLVHLEP